MNRNNNFFDSLNYFLNDIDLVWYKDSSNNYHSKRKNNSFMEYLNFRMEEGLISREFLVSIVLFIGTLIIPLIASYNWGSVMIISILVVYLVIDLGMSSLFEGTGLFFGWIKRYKKFKNEGISIIIYDDYSKLSILDKPLLSLLWFNMIHSHINSESGITIGLEGDGEVFRINGYTSLNVMTYINTTDDKNIHGLISNIGTKLIEIKDSGSHAPSTERILTSMDNKIYDTIIKLESKDYNTLNSKNREMYSKILNSTLEFMNNELNKLVSQENNDIDLELSLELEYLERFINNK